MDNEYVTVESESISRMYIQQLISVHFVKGDCSCATVTDNPTHKDKESAD